MIDDGTVGDSEAVTWYVYGGAGFGGSERRDRAGSHSRGKESGFPQGSPSGMLEWGRPVLGTVGAAATGPKRWTAGRHGRRRRAGPLREGGRTDVTTLKGTIQNGQVVLPEPTDLPDGTEVEILPVSRAEAADDEGPVTPDEIARTLAAMEQIEPFEMTDQERAAIEAERRAHKEWEKARFDAHADRLREMWP